MCPNSQTLSGLFNLQEHTPNSLGTSQEKQTYWQGLLSQYHLLRRYITGNNRVSAEKIAELQVSAYKQRENPFDYFSNRLLLSVAYYKQGGRFQARATLLNLVQESASISLEQQGLKVYVALTLAAAGDYKTALRVISECPQPEFRLELLAFFRQLQMQHNAGAEKKRAALKLLTDWKN